MIVTPTLRQMRFFLALAKTQSFVQAAELCLVNQSSLSKGIKEMEDILQAQLFERGRKITRLSAFGQKIHDDIESVVSQADKISMMAKSNLEAMSGPLRLGVIPTIAPYYLPKILPSIQTNYTDLDVQIYEDTSARIVDKLKNSQLDMILLALPYDVEGLEAEALFDEAFYLAVPKEKLGNLKTAHTKDLKPEELLLLDEGHCMTDHALQACKLQKSDRRQTYSASSLMTLIQMVAGGYGVTLLPEMVVMSNILPDTVSILPFKGDVPYRKIGVAWRPQGSLANNCKTLADYLKNH